MNDGYWYWPSRPYHWFTQWNDGNGYDQMRRREALQNTEMLRRHIDMNGLIEKDTQGNWKVKGIGWKQLRQGEIITKELWDVLYGALWKLMEYEDTGLTPDNVERLKDFEQSQICRLMKLQHEEKKKNGWIPVETEILPDTNRPVWVTREFADGELTVREERYNPFLRHWEQYGGSKVIAWKEIEPYRKEKEDERA